MGELVDGVESLEEEVGDTNGVSGGAVTSVRAADGVAHVGSVVGRVEVLSVLGDVRMTCMTDIDILTQH